MTHEVKRELISRLPYLRLYCLFVLADKEGGQAVAAQPPNNRKRLNRLRCRTLCISHRRDMSGDSQGGSSQA